jgi:GTP cyclohydrolase IA
MENEIARTAFPSGEHVVFTSIEGVAEFLLTSVAGLNNADPQEEKTPERFVRMLREMTTPVPFEFTVFKAEDRNMVTEIGIPFTSLCRHHVLPFTGIAHIAYVPNVQIGVGVIMEAEHLCMTVRGVRAPGVVTRTAAMRGCFADHKKTAKAEFLSSIDNRR